MINKETYIVKSGDLLFSAYQLLGICVLHPDELKRGVSPELITKLMDDLCEFLDGFDEVLCPEEYISPTLDELRQKLATERAAMPFTLTSPEELDGDKLLDSVRRADFIAGFDAGLSFKQEMSEQKRV